MCNIFILGHPFIELIEEKGCNRRCNRFLNARVKDSELDSKRRTLTEQAADEITNGCIACIAYNDDEDEAFFKFCSEPWTGDDVSLDPEELKSGESPS